VSDCARYESLIERYLASDLDPKGMSDLLAHAAGCEGCRRLLAVHGELERAGSAVPEPDEADLERRQVRVLAGIQRRRALRPLRAAAIAAGLILPFGVGVLFGRALPQKTRWMDALHAEASANRGLSDVEDSPFNYSNVSYRRLGGDRVALDFDVTTHLTTVESKDSPLVREVLVQSLLNPATVGERLKAMSFAAGGLDPKLEKAVLFALRNDESLAVRLAALTILVGRLDDEEVRSALIASLRDDPSVQVRLAALESLASHRVDPKRIREAIRERPEPGNEALVVRLAELEKVP